ncbi:hypothetical protein F4803DRAFT_551330 [Xylaria telfairii]|nr:hypothetical protein F4803DRAFT_551330 [Xylaria telfairii]
MVSVPATKPSPSSHRRSEVSLLNAGPPSPYRLPQTRSKYEGLTHQPRRRRRSTTNTEISEEAFQEALRLHPQPRPRNEPPELATEIKMWAMIIGITFLLACFVMAIATITVALLRVVRCLCFILRVLRS